MSVIAVVFILLFTVPGAFGQKPASPAGTDTAGIDELIRTLVKNGVLLQEDVTALQNKVKKGISRLAALTGLLKEKGMVTEEEAGRIVEAEAGEKKKPVTVVTIAPSPPTSRGEQKWSDVVAPVAKGEERERMKAEIKEEVMTEVKATMEQARAEVPDWTKRIRFGGDIRLRYQADVFDANNGLFRDVNNPTELLNSRNDRHRLTLRARLGATANVNDKTEVGIRISTGSITNPVSTSQTLGNDFNKYTVVFDRAYLKYKPIPSLTFIGGRFENPFFHSDLVWSPSVAFDGVAGDYRPKITNSLTGFLIAGVFPVEEIKLQTQDKWLFAGQAGLQYELKKKFSAKLGAAYYYFKNTQGIPNDVSNPNEYDWTAPGFMQKGNAVFDIDPTAGTEKYALASKYHELNITANLDIAIWSPIHVVLMADYVKNLGYDREKVAALVQIPDYKEYTDAYQIGLSVGHKRMDVFGDWRAYFKYRYLERDAIIDAFTDSDFHLGGTNAKGWILGGEFGLRKNVWAAFKWVTSNEIVGLPYAVDSFFLDVNCRF